MRVLAPRYGGKHLLRGLLKELLPEARAPAQTAFRTPAGRWLRGPLAPVLQEQLASGTVFSEEWLARRVVAQLAGEHMAGGGGLAARPTSSLTTREKSSGSPIEKRSTSTGG